MYEIKQITGEDILIRYNNLKHEIDKQIVEMEEKAQQDISEITNKL